MEDLAMATITTITRNTEKNGIEIYFSSIPDESTREALKACGFRWSRFSGCWYNKDTEENMTNAQNITGATFSENTPIIPTTKNQIATTKQKETIAPLFERCKIDKLPKYGTDNNMKTQAREESRENGTGYDKEVAKIISAHLRKQFPECKFSVTSGKATYLNVCNINIKSSPYEKDSEELKAIKTYCEMFHDAFDADNGDYYADYGAHHDLYGSVSISWDYTQTAPTPESKAAREQFQKDKIAHDEAEKEAAHLALAAEMQRQEQERKETEQREKEARALTENIESFAVVEEYKEDEKYFCYGNEIGKASNIAEIKEAIKAGEPPRVLCHVVRSVTLPATQMINFKNLLMHNFSFLTGQGGTATDDPRINSLEDYKRMTKSERNGTQWYSICTAVKLAETGETAFLINPEGYSYARYCYMIDDAPVEPCHYSPIPYEIQKIAEETEDKSTQIITNLNLDVEEWKTSGQYAQEMSEIVANINKSIIQQIKIEPLKIWLYNALEKRDSVQEQCKRIITGKALTIAKINECIGGVSIIYGIVEDVKSIKSAQCSDAIKINITPANKRKQSEYIFTPSSCFCIISGVINIPSSILWEDLGDGRKMARYLSCDAQQIQAIKNYAISIGSPVIVDRSEG